MKFAHFFIHRPIFAIVLSIVLLILGGISYTTLPVASFPEIAPPTVVVTATYPGATNAFLDYMAEWARRIEGEILNSDRPGETILLFRQPIGVVAGRARTPGGSSSGKKSDWNACEASSASRARPSRATTSGMSHSSRKATTG